MQPTCCECLFLPLVMKFSEVIGQQEVKQHLLRSVKEERISHAQLFTGPSGTGKLALAIAYAQYISCKNKQEDDSCGACPSCVKFNKLAHPDFHFTMPLASTKRVTKAEQLVSSTFLTEWREFVLDNPYAGLNEWFAKIGVENKQGNINVHESAEILRKLSLKPYEGEFRILVVWLAEKMNPQCANKLLKIIEEPPQKTIFLLITESAEELLPTILSRVQMVKVPKMADSDIAAGLRTQFELDDKQMQHIVTLSEGSYFTALKMAEHDESAEVHTDKFAEWMRWCYGMKVSELLEFSEEMAKSGRERQKVFLNHAISVLRKALLLNFDVHALVKIADDSEQDFLTKFAPFVHGANTPDLIAEFDKAVYHIERNAYAKIIFMDLSLKIHDLLRVPQEA